MHYNGMNNVNNVNINNNNNNNNNSGGSFCLVPVDTLLDRCLIKREGPIE